MKPPVARRVPHVERRHGREVADDYAWLRERSNPEVLEYLEAENAYTEEVMRPAAELRQRLYDEMLGRIKQTDLSVPERFGAYRYYSRTTEGQQYRTHCRRPLGPADAEEQVLLDENELARDQPYFQLGVLKINPDHQLLAYSVDNDGSETYTLRFKDLRTGETLATEIPGTYDSVEWAADNRTVFFNTLDAAHRPYRLYRYELGRDPAEAELVYQEDDEAFFLGLYKTRSRRFVMLHLSSITTSEVRYLEADDPRGAFRTIHPRQHEMEYSADHRGDTFYILTNDEAIDFKLVAAPVADPAKPNWKPVLAHRKGVKLDQAEAFAGHLAVVEREGGVRGVRVIDLASGAQHKIEQPEPVHTVYLNRNPEFETSVLRFTYTSLVTPESVFDYDMRTRERVLRKEQEVLGGYDKSAYATERVFARAPDGVEVPVSLVYRKDARRPGGTPALLYAYGSYGASVDPTFRSTHLSLLDRGMIYAIAHVRGGGELGRSWYEDGKLLHKKRTFTDFIACAEHLIAAGYTSSDALAISGGSAGGLLVGAVTNMRPDLFKVAVANVPFVDVVTTMLDASIPLTVIEREEWGDPRKPEFHEYMASYSPYENVEAKDYPDLLVTAGLNDPRVAYWEPAKWVARLRATKTDGNVLLLKTTLAAGHGGPSGRYERLKELAFEFAFLLERLGLGGEGC